MCEDIFCAEKYFPPLLTGSDGLVRGHGAVWLDAVLEAVELPARIADLAARLAHVHGDTLTLETNQG